MVHRGRLIYQPQPFPGPLHFPLLSRHGWEEERRGSGRGSLSTAKIEVVII